MALEAWRLLGGMDWQGIPWVVRHLGVPDEDELTLDLIELRNRLHG